MSRTPVYNRGMADAGKIGRCALCLKTRPLVESHLLPAGVYRLSNAKEKTNPHPFLISGDSWLQTAAQVKDYLLCSECEGRFGQKGESWMLRYCCRGRRFRLREDLLARRPMRPMLSEQDFSMYRATPAEVDHLVYFALSIFWRAAAHQWRIGRTPYPSIELGPYENRIREFLLLGAPILHRVALVVCVSSVEKTPLAASFPMGYIDKGRLFHRLHFPGLLFSLYLGNAADEYKDLSILTSPDHPIWFSAHPDEHLTKSILDFVRQNRVPMPKRN
jgi:hypothetical protein